MVGDRLVLHGADHAFMLDLKTEDVRDFFRREKGNRQWDLIIAHAFLDLLNVPRVLPVLKNLARPGGLLYLTINFDGLSAFEPVSNSVLEDKILSLYHHSMDQRLLDGEKSGDSRTGRHLIHWFEQADLRILAAGSSDWVVYPQDGRYPADEAYFLHFILHFFEETLGGQVELCPDELRGWLAERREQIDTGKLVFIAHQMDYLVQAG